MCSDPIHFRFEEQLKRCLQKLRSLMDLANDPRIDGLIARRNRVILAVVAALVTLAISIATSAQETRGERHKRKRDEIPFYKRIIHSTETYCHDQLRMSRKAFFCLAQILRRNGSIKDTLNISLEEQLVMFLHTLGHNLRNRKIAHNFAHSGETISRHFHKVLRAILALHIDYLIPTTPNTPLEILGKDRFDPYFKDCIGAIDGSHIPIIVAVDMQAKYCDRKGNLSQNVMGVCSFDCKFQYILAGWEGSAADSRVLASALSRSDPLVVLPGLMALMNVPICRCGAGPCLLKISNTLKNPGRKFWCCSNRKKGHDGCGFNGWLSDAQMTSTLRDEGTTRHDEGTTRRDEGTTSTVHDGGIEYNYYKPQKAEIYFLRCLLCLVIAFICWDHMQKSP